MLIIFTQSLNANCTHTHTHFFCLPVKTRKYIINNNVWLIFSDNRVQTTRPGTAPHGHRLILRDLSTSHIPTPKNGSSENGSFFRQQDLFEAQREEKQAEWMVIQAFGQMST